MNNKWIKGFSVLLVAVFAIGVNIFGYMKMKDRQQTQQVEQAVLTINSQKNHLETLQKNINQAYADANQDFLRNNLTAEDIRKMENELNRLKVTADDFALAPKDLPQEVEQLSQAKSALQKDLQTVSEKMTLQTKVKDFFTNETLDWQMVTNDVVIKKETTVKKVNDLRDKLNQQPASPWQDQLNEYLDFAAAQATRIAELTADLDEMLQEGVITEAATYERYLGLTESIAQVRNLEMKETFQTQTNQISEQLGLGTTYYSNQNPTTDQASEEEIDN
ncbi:hypothetical protein ACYSNO_09740 [Enterococcus sp. LJL98]